MYFTKTQIDSLVEFYNVCLFRLLNIRLFGLNWLDQKKMLKNFMILPLKLRICYRLNLFVYKILNKHILGNFYSKLEFKDQGYLRDRELVTVPDIRTNYGRLSLVYFLPRFINNVMKASFNLDLKMFKQQLNVNLDLIFENLSKNFFNFS